MGTNRFQLIATIFSFNGRGPFGGNVVISDSAIYLVATSPPITMTSLLTGRLFGPCQDKDLFPIALSELDASIVEDPSWPASREDALVRVFRRSDPTEIWHDRFHLFYHCTLANSNDTVRIRSHLRRPAIIDLLHQYRWHSAVSQRHERRVAEGVS